MSLGSLPRRVTVVEVGPRDGLQNEAAPVTVDDRVSFCNRLLDAGLKVVEVGAFVSPRWVPQMAGSDEVVRRVGRRPGAKTPVLVPNRQGFEQAQQAGVKEIAVFTAASETFNRKNINATIDESFQRFAEFGFVVNLDEGIQVQRVCKCDQILQFSLPQHCHDE